MLERTNTSRGSGSLYEKFISLLRGEKIRYREAAGDVKLTAGGDKQSRNVSFGSFLSSLLFQQV